MDRYITEAQRLYKVLDQRLADRDYVAGEYSIADMAIIGWALGWKQQQVDIDAPLMRRLILSGYRRALRCSVLLAKKRAK